jgi:hypothetical protein
MSWYRWLVCTGCGRRWQAKYIPRSANSPGEYSPDYCSKCFGEGEPEYD